WQMSYLPRPPPVNMLRVTGRPEHQQQTRPWGYGDTMDEAALPPAIRAAACRIRSLPGLRLGRLRDVTINYRHSSFLRLDPHVDPAADGENVFVLSVDAPAVLTLSPRNWYRAGRWLAAAAVGDEREQVRRDAEESWTRWVLEEAKHQFAGGLVVGGLAVSHVAHLAGAAVGVLIVLLLQRLPEPGAGSGGAAAAS
ncbi:hypothetical protein TSOC_002187, partial [Tetrabaena socialis]